MEFQSTRAIIGASGLLPICVFLAILGSVFIGRSVGHRSYNRSNGEKNQTDDTLIGSILGLMALVVAFTFSGAAGRLDQRERLISAETTAIISAYDALRYIDTTEQDALRKLFGQFAEQRSTLYDNVLDFEAFENRQSGIDATIKQLQDAAFSAAIKSAPETRPFATEFVKQVNSMSSAYTNQLQAMWFHPPKVIWVTLVFLILISSFLAGYKMGIAQRHERLLPLMFAALISCAIFLISSLEFPLILRISSLESDARQATTLQKMLAKPPTIGLPGLNK